MDDPTAMLRMWEMARRPELHPAMRRHFGRQLRRHRGDEHARQYIKSLWRQWRHMCRRSVRFGGGGEAVGRIKMLIELLESMQYKIQINPEDKTVQILDRDDTPVDGGSCPLGPQKFVDLQSALAAIAQGGGGGGGGGGDDLISVESDGQSYMKVTDTKGINCKILLQNGPDKYTLEPESDGTFQVLGDDGTSSKRTFQDMFGSSSLCAKTLGKVHISERLCWTIDDVLDLMQRQDTAELMNKIDRSIEAVTRSVHSAKYLLPLLQYIKIKSPATAADIPDYDLWNYELDKTRLDSEYKVLNQSIQKSIEFLGSTDNTTCPQLPTDIPDLKSNFKELLTIQGNKVTLDILTDWEKYIYLDQLRLVNNELLSWKEDIMGSVRVYAIMNDYRLGTDNKRVFAIDPIERNFVTASTDIITLSTAADREAYCDAEAIEYPRATRIFNGFHWVFDTAYKLGGPLHYEDQPQMWTKREWELYYNQKLWTSPAHYYLGDVMTTIGLSTNRENKGQLLLQSTSSDESEGSVAEPQSKPINQDDSWKEQQFYGGDGSIREVAEMAAKGRSVVVMASGYSGSGKTYILTGDEKNRQDIEGDYTKQGILHLALLNLPEGTIVQLDTVVELYGGINPFPFVPSFGAQATKDQIPKDKDPPPAPTMSYIFYHPNGHTKGKLEASIQHQCPAAFVSQVQLEEVTMTKVDVDSLNSLLEHVDKKRKAAKRVRSTPNNPNSSRGHTFYTFKITSSLGKKGFFTVCDMAGLENPRTMIDKFLHFEDKRGMDPLTEKPYANVPFEKQIKTFMDLYYKVQFCLPPDSAGKKVYDRHCWASFPRDKGDLQDRSLCLNAIFQYPTSNITEVSNPSNVYNPHPATDSLVKTTNTFGKDQSFLLDIGSIHEKLKSSSSLTREMVEIKKNVKTFAWKYRSLYTGDFTTPSATEGKDINTYTVYPFKGSTHADIVQLGQTHFGISGSSTPTSMMHPENPFLYCAGCPHVTFEDASKLMDTGEGIPNPSAAGKVRKTIDTRADINQYLKDGNTTKLFVATEKYLGNKITDDTIYMYLKLSQFENGKGKIKKNTYLVQHPYGDDGDLSLLEYTEDEEASATNTITRTPLGIEEGEIQHISQAIRVWLDEIYKLVSEAFWINETLNHLQEFALTMNRQVASKHVWPLTSLGRSADGDTEYSTNLFLLPESICPKPKEPVVTYDRQLQQYHKYSVIYISDPELSLMEATSQYSIIECIYHVYLWSLPLQRTVHLIFQSKKKAESNKTLTFKESATNWFGSLKNRYRVILFNSLWESNVTPPNIDKTTRIKWNQTWNVFSSLSPPTPNNRNASIKFKLEYDTLDNSRLNIGFPGLIRVEGRTSTSIWLADLPSLPNTENKQQIRDHFAFYTYTIDDGTSKRIPYSTESTVFSGKPDLWKGHADPLRALFGGGGGAMTYMFNTCMHLITEEFETRAADPTVTTLESLHSGTAVPYILNNDVTIPAVGMQYMMTSVLTTLQDKGTTDPSSCPIGNPKLVMLFIMRPQLTASEEDKRFCNGAVDTLKTAVRMTGESVGQDAAGCLASDATCYSIASYTSTPSPYLQEDAKQIVRSIKDKFEEAAEKEETRVSELQEKWSKIKTRTNQSFKADHRTLLATIRTKTIPKKPPILRLGSIPEANNRFDINFVYEYTKSVKFILDNLKSDRSTDDDVRNLIDKIGLDNVQQLQDELQTIRKIYYREGTWPKRLKS